MNKLLPVEVQTSLADALAAIQDISVQIPLEDVGATVDAEHFNRVQTSVVNALNVLYKAVDNVEQVLVASNARNESEFSKLVPAMESVSKRLSALQSKVTSLANPIISVPLDPNPLSTVQLDLLGIRTELVGHINQSNTSGLPMGTVDVVHRLGLPIPTLSPMKPVVLLNGSSTDHWGETILSKVLIIADADNISWLTGTEYASGAAAKLDFTFETPITVTNIDIVPFSQFPVKFLTVEVDGRPCWGYGDPIIETTSLISIPVTSVVGGKNLFGVTGQVFSVTFSQEHYTQKVIAQSPQQQEDLKYWKESSLTQTTIESVFVEDSTLLPGQGESTILEDWMSWSDTLSVKLPLEQQEIVKSLGLRLGKIATLLYYLSTSPVVNRDIFYEYSYGFRQVNFLQEEFSSTGQFISQVLPLDGELRQVKVVTEVSIEEGSDFLPDKVTGIADIATGLSGAETALLAGNILNDYIDYEMLELEDLSLRKNISFRLSLRDGNNTPSIPVYPDIWTRIIPYTPIPLSVPIGTTDLVVSPTYTYLANEDGNVYSVVPGGELIPLVKPDPVAVPIQLALDGENLYVYCYNAMAHTSALYSWNGTSWDTIDTFPNTVSVASKFCAFTNTNKFVALGVGDTGTVQYKYVGASWIETLIPNSTGKDQFDTLYTAVTGEEYAVLVENGKLVIGAAELLPALSLVLPAVPVWAGTEYVTAIATAANVIIVGTNVGRLVSLTHNTTWTYADITTVNSNIPVTDIVMDATSFLAKNSIGDVTYYKKVSTDWVPETPEHIGGGAVAISGVAGEYSILGEDGHLYKRILSGHLTWFSLLKGMKNLPLIEMTDTYTSTDGSLILSEFPFVDIEAINTYHTKNYPTLEYNPNSETIPILKPFKIEVKLKDGSVITSDTTGKPFRITGVPTFQTIPTTVNTGTEVEELSLPYLATNITIDDISTLKSNSSQLRDIALDIYTSLGQTTTTSYSEYVTRRVFRTLYKNWSSPACAIGLILPDKSGVKKLYSPTSSTHRILNMPKVDVLQRDGIVIFRKKIPENIQVEDADGPRLLNTLDNLQVIVFDFFAPNTTKPLRNSAGNVLVDANGNTLYEELDSRSLPYTTNVTDYLSGMTPDVSDKPFNNSVGLDDPEYFPVITYSHQGREIKLNRIFTKEEAVEISVKYWSMQLRPRLIVYLQRAGETAMPPTQSPCLKACSLLIGRIL